MNILFLGLSSFENLNQRGIYADLLRELAKKGNTVFAATPTERREKRKTFCNRFNCHSFLLIKTFNIQKTNLLEKGIGTLAIKGQFIRAIKKYFKGIKFDLILYPTPPITLYGVVKYFKKRDNAKTYLMLKDIFPQNAVDLGIMKTTGLKGLIYKYFRKQEKKLYAVSDRIGCMSPANVEYVLKNNLEVNKDKTEVFPNCIEVQDISSTDEEKKAIRIKYGLPLNKRIFVYGGNLGKPQGIPFIIECIKAAKSNDKAFFLIAGDGTEFNKLESFFNNSKLDNFMLFQRLPSNEFNQLLLACDVGLIFLDYRFTIPNFPSRLLSYLQAGLPVFACTDRATDIGKIIVDGGVGWWCESRNVNDFCQTINISLEEFCKKKKNALQFLKDNYSLERYTDLILGK